MECRYYDNVSTFDVLKHRAAICFKAKQRIVSITSTLLRGRYNCICTHPVITGKTCNMQEKVLKVCEINLLP